MSFFETGETHQFTFEAFAAHPFYTAINRSLVQQALASLVTGPVDATLTIVDMACGTGAITRLIAETMAHQGRQARIIAVDPSADALRRAQKSIEAMGATAEFFQGEADDLPHLVQHADAAFFCNAIHLLADKRSAFRHIAAILAPGGIFACNSAFYEGTSVEETWLSDRFGESCRRLGGRRLPTLKSLGDIAQTVGPHFPPHPPPGSALPLLPRAASWPDR